MKRVSTQEAADLAGCTFRQADHWIRIGLLNPFGTGSGRGYPRLWDTEEITVLALVAKLMRLGVSTDEVRMALVVIGRDPRDWPARFEWGDSAGVFVDLDAVKAELVLDDDVTAAAM